MPVKRCLGIVVLLIFGNPYGVSQTSVRSSTELTGLVTDPTGASLPKARVLLVDLKSLKTTTMEIGADGVFAFPKTKSGEYAVIVVGPSSKDSACWQPAIRQIHITEGVAANLRVPLLLDFKRCGPGVVN